MTAGGAWSDGRLVTWGDHLRSWTGGGQPEILLPGPFDHGCAFAGGFALQRGEELIWWRAGSVQMIDPAAPAVDLAEATLGAKPGLLISYRGMQLRYFTPPDQPRDRWPYREIYSFYTASEQGGLLFRDLDGDGREDVITGNYWVQRPASPEESWRLFAINLLHDHPLAASARLVWFEGRLLWLESKRSPGRAYWFRPPADPRQLWIEEIFPIELRFPRAVLAAGGRLWIGENNGAQSRLIEWPKKRIRPAGGPVHAFVETPTGVVIIGPSGIPRPLPA
jgi:hypothetical protein